jgi:hypothetical protein
MKHNVGFLLQIKVGGSDKSTAVIHCIKRELELQILQGKRDVLKLHVLSRKISS